MYVFVMVMKKNTKLRLIFISRKPTVSSTYIMLTKTYKKQYTVLFGKKTIVSENEQLIIRMDEQKKYIPCQGKNCLRTFEKSAELDHLVNQQTIIQAFALHLYILYYPMIPLANCEGTDQTTWMHRVICAFAIHCACAVRICPMTRFRMAHGAAAPGEDSYQTARMRRLI